MRVALRVEVNSLRGLRQGVPNLMRLFSEYQVRASFFFPLGRDYAGRSLFRTWHERRRLGIRALAYGTLIPAPELGREGADLMATARANGHEVGVFGLSPVHWSRRLAHADESWVRKQCEEMWFSFLNLGGVAPCALATPRWQVNPALLTELSAQKFRYSSLSRGKLPFYPVLQGVRSAIPEIPTTLPSVDELLQQPAISLHNVHEYLYAESRHVLPAGHVFTVSAEHEGLERLSVMEKLLVMWKGQDGSVRALGDVLEGIDPSTLPRHQIGWGSVAGGKVAMAMQNVKVPA